MKKGLPDDNIKDILKTYRQVNDKPQNSFFFTLKLRWKNKSLEKQISLLKSQQDELQKRLSSREQELKILNDELTDKMSHVKKLETDFELLNKQENNGENHC